jgi:ATP-dependent helicase Lhr and Lhr-like helicase
MTGLQQIETWFKRSGWTPFEFQRATWNAFLRGESGLVHAPTGMGKTYAVWLGPLAEYLNEAQEPATSKSGLPLRVLWLTPLRALANDTAQNLRLATEALNIPWKVELRTGDTSASVRARHRKQLPETLITTPESLSVMLSYPGNSDHLRDVRCVIVDEWHELLGTKRGVQTELCLAHLRALSPHLRTWGLSATLGNLDQAMAVLIGTPALRAGTPGSESRATLISGDIAKRTVVETLRPDEIERFPWSGHIGIKLLQQVIASIESARSTLLFTNVRSQAEIWFQQILKARPDLIGQVALHHGSIDRNIREQVEDLLRTGRIKCVVCTSSLDLGVDFSPVDQVMQLGSPKGIARMMQRAGRSGHQPGAVSKILGVPTNALELVEFAAAREAVQSPSPSGRGVRGEGSAHSMSNDSLQTSGACPHPSPLPQGEGVLPHIESRTPLDRPLDVLVQHLVTLASGDGFEAELLKREIKSTHAYHELTDDEWQWALDFITQGGPALHAYPQYARVIQQDDKYIVASPQIQRMHRMMIGTITADAAVKVAFVNGATLGTIEESFISRLNTGDRFVFAGRVLELLRLHNLVAHVRKAKQVSGTVPRWMGGRSPLSTLLSRAVRLKIDEARRGIYNSPEMELIKPLLELQRQWSVIPKPDELLIERSKSRDGHHLFVFPFEGRLVHEGLSSLVAHRLTSDVRRSMHVTANDYGFELLSRDAIELEQDEWRQVFTIDNLVEDLLACLNTTALAKRAFRDIARVAGLIFPGFPGQGKTARQLQASSQLFFEVFHQYDPGNLLLDQARREVLDRELEVTRMRETLERIQQSQIVIVNAQSLTPLGFPIWAESIRTQHVSSETWSDRVKRMAVMLEEEAEKLGRGSKRKTKRSREPAPEGLGT